MSIVESTMTKCQTFFQSLKAEAEQADSLLQLSLEPSLEKRGRGQLRGRTWSLTWTLAPGGTSLGYFTAHGIQDRRKVWKSGCWGGHNLKALLRPYYTAKRTREILISNFYPLSPQKWSQFVHFNIEKVFPRGQPWICPSFSDISKIESTYS